jgi:hypothetical protein
VKLIHLNFLYFYPFARKIGINNININRQIILLTDLMDFPQILLQLIQHILDIFYCRLLAKFILLSRTIESSSELRKYFINKKNFEIIFDITTR